MEGYVYIARIIDHGGKFVNGYHKIGLSKQYKVRETQLNSTHLPFDVLMTRVFETENMKKLEGLLHVCFEDYRVVKEYDYRRNITTEWFDVSDIDMFNERLDKFIELMGIREIDMDESIDSDNTLTQTEKVEAKERVGKAKASMGRLTIDGQVYEGESQKHLFIRAIKEIVRQVGPEKVANELACVKMTKDEFIGYRNFIDEDTIENTPSIDFVDGAYVYSYIPSYTKVKLINQLKKEFNITNINLEMV